MCALYGSHARRHRGALCSACVGHAVRCACGAVTPARAQSATTFFADRLRLQQKQTSYRAAASACCSSRQSTRRCHRCCVCTLPTLRRLWLHDFVGVRGSLALTWPRHMGRALVGCCSSLVWRKPSAMRAGLLLAASVCCAYIYDVGDTGFLLVRCVHSPGATRVLLANTIIVPFLTQETEPNPNKKPPRDLGTFVRFLEPNFFMLSFFGGSGQKITRRNQTVLEFEHRKHHT